MRDGRWCRVFDGGKTDVARVEQLTSTLEKKLAAYEVIFGKHKYLAGDVSSRVQGHGASRSSIAVLTSAM